MINIWGFFSTLDVDKTSLVISIFAIVISFVGNIYMQKQYVVAKQQYELEMKQFIEELKRRGLSLEIMHCDMVMAINRIDTEVASRMKYFKKGKIAGVNFIKRIWLGEETTRIFNLGRWENMMVGIVGYQIETELVISNTDDIPLHADRLTIDFVFNPTADPPFWNKILGKMLSVKSMEENIIVSVQYDLLENRVAKVQTLTTYLGRGSKKAMEDAKAFHNLFEKNPRMFKKDVKIIDALTLERVDSPGGLTVEPKSKVRWRIKLAFTDLFCQVYAESKVTLTKAEITLGYEKRVVTDKENIIPAYVDEFGLFICKMEDAVFTRS